MNRGKIFLVDDDIRLCRLVSRYLERDGYETCIATSGEGMRLLLQSQQFILIILDIMLPDKDGFALAQEIRGFSNIPIIFLSAKSDVATKVNGLETGADDYITKPFEPTELLARVQSVLRRSKQPESPQRKTTCARFAGWMLNLVDHTLTCPKGRRVAITSSEYQLLCALISKANGVITRDEILSVLSGREWSPLDRSVDMAVSKLRKKIEPDLRNPILIKTIRNKGYQFATDVEFDE
jgi:two-component system, OmpR family, response regulator